MDYPIKPYEFQFDAHNAVVSEIENYTGPVIVDAAVSSGKTILISMLCDYAKQRDMSVLVLSRQAEIISQDSAELWKFRVAHSVFCAGLNKKGASFPVVVGSEGTVVNGLHEKLRYFKPDLIVIDECHHMSVDDYLQAEFEDNDDGRSAYTVIIREMKRRNPGVMVVGYTGTPYRGTRSIVGGESFWKKVAYQISTNYLVEHGAVVPTIFGAHCDGYDLSEFSSNGSSGARDFSEADMKEMQRVVMKDRTLTQKIMRDVVELTKNRNGVLVTCAGVRHCKEAASVLPPDVTHAIITEDTKAKERMRIVDGARRGEIKFVFQVQALTTGVNVPMWDTSVLLRRIGSLTLLTQLLGRGMRILRDSDARKVDHLVLDYSGTMDDIGELYEDPILDDYHHQYSSDSEGTKECPECDSEVNKRARRCGCGYHFIYTPCPECAEKNDPSVRYCTGCGHTLKDPNDGLEETYYAKTA